MKPKRKTPLRVVPRLGDGFVYVTSEWHDDASRFRERQIARGMRPRQAQRQEREAA